VILFLVANGFSRRLDYLSHLLTPHSPVPVLLSSIRSSPRPSSSRPSSSRHRASHHAALAQLTAVDHGRLWSQGCSRLRSTVGGPVPGTAENRQSQLFPRTDYIIWSSLVGASNWTDWTMKNTETNKCSLCPHCVSIPLKERRHSYALQRVQVFTMGCRACRPISRLCSYISWESQQRRVMNQQLPSIGLHSSEVVFNRAIEYLISEQNIPTEN
jgi:hypothetical protein